MSVQSKLGDICLRAHIKAGDSRANSFAFALRADSWKKSYLTVEELEWLADNGPLIREVIAANISVIRSASERKTDRDAQKTIEKHKKNNPAPVMDMTAMMQAFATMMAAQQKSA